MPHKTPTAKWRQQEIPCKDILSLEDTVDGLYHERLEIQALTTDTFAGRCNSFQQFNPSTFPIFSRHIPDTRCQKQLKMQN